jgi:alcohol dehydrogenase YqhD (iron-dependent ADH family)
MIPFQYHNPTRLIFGVSAIAELQHFAPQLGQRILLVYGGGSILQNGVHAQVIAALQQAGVAYLEFSGVEPNPRCATLQKAVTICHEQQIDGVLAVGGGSVLDGAKAICAAVAMNADVWDIVVGNVKVSGALPLGTVLTLAATGSEMNSNSVITNWDTNEKIGWSSPFTYPRFSILDPQTTCSVPVEHTVYGIVDIMSHILEQYMHHQEQTPVQDGIAETLLRTVIEQAPLVLQNPHNVLARTQIMYCGTMALNGLLSMGVRGDWATHNLEHAVSALYDIPHGGGLAILFPQWMRYALDQGIGSKRLAQLGTNVFGLAKPSTTSPEELLTCAYAAIDRLQQFWQSLGAPTRFADYGITHDRLEEMATRTMRRGPFGRFITLDQQDVIEIFRRS